MATDAATLLAVSKCYQCYGSNEYALQLMKLSLLRQILLASDPMADTTPQTLLAASKCYQCYASSPYMLSLIELGLLKLIVDNGGTGGGGNCCIELENAPVDRANFPVNEPPPADQTHASFRLYRDNTPMVRWDPISLFWF